MTEEIKYPTGIQTFKCEIGVLGMFLNFINFEKFFQRMDYSSDFHF